MGRPARGSRGLGRAHVCGRIRVPNPAIGITSFIAELLMTGAEASPFEFMPGLNAPGMYVDYNIPISRDNLGTRHIFPSIHRLCS